MNDSNVVEFADALNDWIDSLVLKGNSGRRAVFVERSLKRRYKMMVAKAARLRHNQVPSNWEKGISSYKLLTLWHLTVNISRKFKTEIPEQFKFRKLLNEL